MRQLEIVGGQLYYSTGSGATARIGLVGYGLPTTSGQMITGLPGFPTTGSPYEFFFADLSHAVAGFNTDYMADDAVGIEKFSFDGLQSELTQPRRVRLR